MDNLSPHALIQSFVSGLSDFLTTLVPPSARTSVPRMFFIAGSDFAFSWVSDVDGVLVAIEDDGSSGGAHTVSLAAFNTSNFAGVSKFFPQVIFVGGASASPFSITGMRFPVRKGDRIWFGNGGASPFRCVIWFET